MIENLVRPATCLVTCGNETGTGFLVAKDKVLTARHCIKAAIDAEAGIGLKFQRADKEIAVPATIFEVSEDLDACILSIDAASSTLCAPLPLGIVLPREGSEWLSFAYPVGKTTVGHRLSGKISHTLSAPKAKVDIDLLITATNQLQSYHGCSGGPLMNGAVCKGMLRLRFPGTLGAISFSSMRGFLLKGGVEFVSESTEQVPKGGDLAPRTRFQQSFERQVVQNGRNYLFLQGAHGIGKTTFCTRYSPTDAQVLVLGAYCIKPSHGPLGAAYRIQPEVFFDWLSTTISNLLYGKPSRVEPKSYVKLIQETNSLLQTFSGHCEETNKHGLLFIDGLNEIEATALPVLLGLLPVKLPTHLTVVLTAPNYANVAAHLSDRIAKQNVCSLPLLPTEACEWFCRKRLVGGLSDSTRVARISKKSGGHPLYLRYLIKYANEHPGDRDLKDFPILDGEIEQYYEGIWATLQEDAYAAYLLAIVARLRGEISPQELLTLLTQPETVIYKSTLTRIQHLLSGPEWLKIYHFSFTAFILCKTAELEKVIQQRLGEFCQGNAQIHYCQTNVVYHLLRSNEVDQRKAVEVCNQSWVDSCVAVGIPPDVLLADIQATIQGAVSEAQPVEVVRLLLLLQRVNFRYNALLAQSTDLLAEALISLRRPKEALDHLIRFDTLIVDPRHALDLAFRLIEHGDEAEAVRVLALLKQRCVDAESQSQHGYPLEDFIEMCRVHVQTLLLMHLADGNDRLPEVFKVLALARCTLESSFYEKDRGLFDECLAQVTSILTGSLLCFRDAYLGISVFQRGKRKAPPSYGRVLVHALSDHLALVERLQLPKKRDSLARLLSDLNELFTAGPPLGEKQIPAAIDVVIRCGGSPALAAVLAGREFLPERPGRQELRASNAVDPNYDAARQLTMSWRLAGYFNARLECPLVGAFDAQNWLNSIEQLFEAVSWCEGRWRRGKVDGDVGLQNEVEECLRRRVLPALTFTLAKRVTWDRAYGIPEALLPFVYDQVSQLIVECSAEILEAFVNQLDQLSGDQLGLYSEGYRACMHVIIKNLTRDGVPVMSQKAFALLKTWRNHVLRGVENRHELVPEILRLIVSFIKAGAREEAQNLFDKMLSVSMGPSWYKEDQFGIIDSVLTEMSPEEIPQDKLALVAGYLERSDGEMTFQRYVRNEKSNLLGTLFRKGLFGHGCKYFQMESCGDTNRLVSELERTRIDAPTKRIGFRYPGNALEEQGAALQMVANARGLDWRLRWGLLEVFHLGDERHVDSYAAEYAKIINEAGIDQNALAELAARTEALVANETDPSQRRTFAESLQLHLNPTYKAAFSRTLEHLSDPILEPNSAMPTTPAPESKEPDQDKDEGMYLPGVFGRSASMREADRLLDQVTVEIGLGNRTSAKSHLLKLLRILQDGGWSIWGNLSASSKRSEELLRELSANASELTRCYGELLASELHTSPWVMANHLITRIGGFLTKEEKKLLLCYVLDHIRVMIGDAGRETDSFDFLNASYPQDPGLEVFAFILSLTVYPKWLRRERAAVVVAWLVSTDSRYLGIAAQNAFRMTEGHAADVLCGVLDSLSAIQPTKLWDRVLPFMQPQAVLEECRHISRLATLHRIAARARSKGSASAAEVATRIESAFRPSEIALDSAECNYTVPEWAGCVREEWNSLGQLGVITHEMCRALETKMAELCIPLSIEEGLQLERAVSRSFREAAGAAFNRWETRVRFALNCVLFPYASARNFAAIEIALRVFNPSIPENSLTPHFKSHSAAILDAMDRTQQFGQAIGDEDYYFLDYQEMVHNGDSDTTRHIEVIGVTVPTLRRTRGWFTPPVRCTFRSTEVPYGSREDASVHETCVRLEPKVAFFGSVTPSVPLARFASLIHASEGDFVRRSWRNGRSGELRTRGMPEQEGCLLAVRKDAVKLPEGTKLAWIIQFDGQTVAMVDNENNRLL